MSALKLAPAPKTATDENTNPLVKSAEDLNLPVLSDDKATAIRQVIDFCKSTDGFGLLFDRGMGLVSWLRGSALNALEGRLEHGDWQIVYQEIGYSQQSCSWYRRIATSFSRQQAEGFGYQKCRDILDEEKSLADRPRKGNKSKTAKTKTPAKGGRSDKKKFDIRVFAADVKTVSDKTTDLLKRAPYLRKSWASKKDSQSVLTNSLPFIKTAVQNLEDLRSTINDFLSAK